MDDLPSFESETRGSETRRWPTRWLAILLLLVFVCGLLATPLALLYRWYRSRPPLAVQTTPGEHEQINRIAYITPDHQLATIAPDGSDFRRLTDFSHRYQFPAWSPDGTHLAVLGGDSLFAVADVDDGAVSNLQRLYRSRDEPPFYLYWSPDSRQVSFLASHPSGIALHLAGLDQGSESRILAVGQPFYWAWTPSGDQILMHSGFSGVRARLALLDPSKRTSGVNIAEPGFFQAPGMSTTGAYRAFAEVDEDGNSQLVVEKVDGERLLAEPHLGQVALSWSPSADLLAYISPSVESSAFYGPLRLLEPMSGDQQTLVPENVMAYFWSPDGRSIAYFTVPVLDDGGVQAAYQAAKRRYLGKPGAQHGDIRLDLWVVDVQSGDRQRLVTFEPPELFFSQFLPFFDQYALSHRLWSPAGDELVMSMMEDGVSRIFIVPIDSREPRPLTEGVIAFWSHQ